MIQHYEFVSHRMPRRKQPAKLRTRDAAGQLLARRKRWHSHGEDRQNVRGKTAYQDSLVEAKDPALAKHLDKELEWFEADEWTYYIEQNGWDDRSLNELTVLLQDVGSQYALGDIAPPELKAVWLSQYDVPEVLREALEQRIENPWSDDEPLAAQIRKRLPGLDIVEDMHKLCAAEGRPHLTDSILYFASLWIRSPLQFQGNSVRALIDHLFVRYPVPEVLYQAWFQVYDAYEPNSKWLKWFICFGQGASLYALSGLSPEWAVHRRFQHHFSQVDNAATPEIAILSAELARLGVEGLVAECILQNPRYQRDITSRWYEQDVRQANFLQETAQWLHNHRAELNERQITGLLDWGHVNFQGNPEFSWQGRTVAACMRRIENSEHVSRWVPPTWKPLNMDWSDGHTWSLVELTAADELRAEADVLQHCVSGYHAQCALGSSAIFSLRKDGERAATIELDKRTREVMQARGYKNRSLTRDEAVVLQEWLHAEMEKE